MAEFLYALSGVCTRIRGFGNPIDKIRN